MTIKRYRRKPVDVAAIQWTGKKSSTSLILNWVQMQGASATYHKDFDGDPDCKDLIFHDLHGRCPSCSYRDDVRHLLIDGIRLDLNGYIVSDPAGGLLLYTADEFEKSHEEIK